MEFMVGLLPGLGDTELAQMAEDLGYSHFGVGDGPILFGDPFVHLAVAARTTQTIKLGTMVVNPVTRIPPAIANAHATLQGLAPGRVFIGIGAANNAMRSLGMPPAHMDELEDAIHIMRALLNGERVQYSWRGRTVEIELLDKAGTMYDISRPIPIYVAAGGPKSLDVAARTGDGVVYSMGCNESLVKLVRREIDASAKSAGRDPSSVKLISLVWWRFRRKGESLADAVRGGLGSALISTCVNRRQFLLAHRGIFEPELVDDVVRLSRAYLGAQREKAGAHLDVWKSYVREVGDRFLPLITPRIVDSFAIYGTEDECLEKLARMAAAGTDAFVVFLSDRGRFREDLLDFSRAIIRRWPGCVT
jgi:alkanesulfonate monooxygenase SsuD/methylene tetrahydromethanopterin reductase-like flavin-dependent oxidoreductase (luciferase family)